MYSVKSKEIVLALIIAISAHFILMSQSLKMISFCEKATLNLHHCLIQSYLIEKLSLKAIFFISRALMHQVLLYLCYC